MPHEENMTFEEFIHIIENPSDSNGAVHYIQRQNSNLSQEMPELMDDIKELEWAKEAFGKSDEETGEEEDEVPPMASPEHLTLLPSPYTSLIPGSLPAMRLQQAALQIAAQVAKKEGKELKKLPRPAYWTIITGMVIISTLVIALDAPRVQIILIAQVFNGCLLPFFSICLLLCLNDPQFMSASPQKAWANIFLVISVSH